MIFRKNMKEIFNILLYKPLLNALVALYYLTHDFGLSIILLTVLIKLILYPSSVKSMVFQRRIAKVQPQIKEIQKKYKNDKEKQSRALMELYQKEKITPLSGCLPGIIEAIIFLSLFLVIRGASNPAGISGGLYHFFPQTMKIDLTLFGFIDLTKSLWTTTSGKVLVFVTGFLQFLQLKRSQEGVEQKKGDFQKEMLYFFPILTIIILAKFPAALGIYWLTTTVFSLLQQELVLRKIQ